MLDVHIKTHFKVKKKVQEKWLCEFCSYSADTEDSIVIHTQDNHHDEIEVRVFENTSIVFIQLDIELHLPCILGFLARMFHLCLILSYPKPLEIPFTSMWQKGSISK